MKFNSSSSLSLSSKGSNEDAYKGYKVQDSDSSHGKMSFDKKSDSSSDKAKNGLGQVDEENDNYQLLTNFLKRQDQFVDDEPGSYIQGESYLLPASTIAMAVIGWLLIATSVCLSKYVYIKDRLSTWEDIYGRTLVGSILSYVLMVINNTSPFDIAPHIRNKLFLMQT